MTDFQTVLSAREYFKGKAALARGLLTPIAISSARRAFEAFVDACEALPDFDRRLIRRCREALRSRPSCPRMERLLEEMDEEVSHMQKEGQNVKEGW